ncbi:putative ribosomal protein L13 [Helianthus annuus]|nr:putative ribosomal protein L13 [Helianthus annuus]
MGIKRTMNLGICWEALFTEAGPALEVLSDTLNAIDARQGYQIVYYTHLCSRNWLFGNAANCLLVLFSFGCHQIWSLCLPSSMIPHKTKRGAAALARLKVYEGVPTPYNRKKRMVIPDALKVLRLTAGHKYCLLGRLSSEVGWNHYETIKELENKRKEKAQVVYERKKQLNKLRAKADKAAEEKLCSQLEILAPVTY